MAIIGDYSYKTCLFLGPPRAGNGSLGFKVFHIAIHLKTLKRVEDIWGWAQGFLHAKWMLCDPSPETNQHVAGSELLPSYSLGAFLHFSPALRQYVWPTLSNQDLQRGSHNFTSSKLLYIIESESNSWRQDAQEPKEINVVPQAGTPLGNQLPVHPGQSQHIELGLEGKLLQDWHSQQVFSLWPCSSKSLTACLLYQLKPPNHLPQQPSFIVEWGFEHRTLSF